MTNLLGAEQKWIFKGKDKYNSPISIATTLPLDSASALLTHKKISDPYYSDQEHECYWIYERDWELVTHFNIDEKTAALLKKKSHTLILDLTWVDTHAKLYINGKKIAEITNMFDRNVYDLSKKVKAGENTLYIELLSIKKLAELRTQKVPFPIPGAIDRVCPHMNMVRKVQCHGGWDWGIALMVSGIYKLPELCVHRIAKPMYLTHEQEFIGKKVRVHITLHLEGYGKGNVHVMFQLGSECIEKEFHVVEGMQEFTEVFELKSPELWWPAGHGKQKLYTLSATVEQDTEHEYTIHQKIGIRKISWQCNKDSQGQSMTLIVNGKKIFCKGANWIPTDAMPTKQQEKYRYLLEAARDAHMNMLRVWGGGQYEHDEFYELCDELGILIWQDMMFACALYPSEPWFIDEVQSELSHQIRRISHHPSIAIYCGDNEVIGAINWYEESRNNKITYTVNYDRLNRAIAESVKQYDHTRLFWPSSPCNGELDFGDAWHDDSKGDMHYWDVWHSGASFERYYSVKPRFCSEFGFQSFSSISTTATFTTKDQFNITSPDMEHHQKNPCGNSIILEMFSRYFRIPSSFEQQVYLSQLQQAFAITLGIEFWRSIMPICMGTLYWQLNDNWPVTSWSSIEYTGRWKQLHYQIKRVYHSILVTARVENESIIYTMINEHKQTMIYIEGGVYNLEGTLVHDISGEYLAKAERSMQFKKHSFSNMNIKRQHCFVYFRYYTLKENKKNYIGEKTLFLCPPKQVNLPESDIRIDTKKRGACQFEIILQSSNPVFYVFLELQRDRGRFSENCLSILPMYKKKLQCISERDMSIEEFNGTLRVMCLNDIR